MKAILVIDNMPDNINLDEYTFSLNMFKDIGFGDRMLVGTINDFKLIPLPKKKTNTEAYRIVDKSYFEGWNACLDKILRNETKGEINGSGN